MVNLDWNLIKAADISILANDEDAADEYFAFLSQGSLGNEKDPENLAKLFEVTRVVMNMKAMQYEVAVDEIEKVTHEVASDREKNLLSKLQLMQSQLEQYQKHSGAGESYFRSEILALEQQNKLLEQELIESNNRLRREQSTYDRMTLEIQQMEAKYLETKQKLDTAQSDILEYQRQFQSQRANITTHRTDVDEIREQIKKKNKEMSQYLDDIKQLQDENDKLVQDVENAKKELEQATQDMNSITDDYGKLKVILEDTDAVLEEMRKERDILRSQIHDMTVQLQKQTDGDDKIMNELNQKVLQWKDILSAKDEEIANYKLEVFNLERQLRTAQLDSDHNDIVQLTEANKRKDEQINELKKKLELATKDYNEYIDQINTLKSTSKESSSILQQKKINKLNQTLQQEQLNTKTERERIIEIEKDVIEKDRQITELTNRIIQYEHGEYGLSEAVQEIKDCRVQIRIRDRNIEDLTSQINALNEEVDILTIENEEMRERLGIESRDVLDVTNLRKKKAVKEEQAHSLNRVLQKEIEVLEEERVQLKKALRKQALDRGKRAVELGLSSEDLEEPYDISTVSPKSKIVKKYIQEKSSPIEEDSTRLKILEEQNNILEQQKKTLEEENKILKEESSKLEIGLREINGALKSGVSPMVLQVPALDTLIAIIEQRHATGQYDTTLQLKAQLNNLAGRNDELRWELQTARSEITKLTADLERKIFKIDILENEILNLNENRENVVKINPLPLPAGVNPTSKDIIACLNEYLIQVLQELSNKEEICNDMERCLEDCRRKYSVLAHQQSILYQEHIQLKMQAEEEKLDYEKKKEDLLQQRAEDHVRLQEFENFFEKLNSEPDDNKHLLVEMTRKITVMAVNLKSITRKYTVIQDVEKNLRKENLKIRKDTVDLEASVTSKIGELERYKAMCIYKINALQKILDDSVPSSDLELANRQFNELTSKYRDLLQKDNFLVERTSNLEGLQADLKALNHTNVTIKENLLLEKERNYVLQQTLNDLLSKMGKSGDGQTYRSEEISSLARKLATLEMKELNEREKAEHAMQKYEQLKCLVNELETRNLDLEKKFADISKLNLQSQRIEQELSHQLANCVPSEVNRVDKQRILKLEEQLAQLTNECSQLKEVADVAQHQTETVQIQLTSQEKELTSLRKQMYQQQMETDEKTIIAKLHHQIIALQVSEATAVHKLQLVSTKLSAKETELIKLQNLLSDQNETIFHIRSEARSKTMFLKKMVQDLRRQFSGALPIANQERFSETLRSIQEKKIELEKELELAYNKRSSAEILASELKLKLEGLEELISTLKDGQGAKKVMEWHNRMSEIKLDDMKLKHQIIQLQEKVIYLERIRSKNESSIALLEELSVKQSKEYDDRQLLWEQHEVELERKIVMLEKQQQGIMDAAKKFEEATGSIPNDSLPIANQLDIAIGKIQEHIKTIIVTKAEIVKLTEKLQVAEEKVRKAESVLLQKDKIINELRIRLPLNDREVKFFEADINPMENREVQLAVRVAQATIDSLKLMLAKKDESLVKYQNMLNQSREEIRTLTEAHRHEMKVLQERLQLEIDEHIKKIKKMHEDYINAPQPIVATTQQLARLSELEEVVKEQDVALGTASERYRNCLLQVKQIKEECEESLKKQKEQSEKESQEYAEEVLRLKKEIEDNKIIIREKDLEIEVFNEELEGAKVEVESSKKMKSLVERLRNQLAKKDTELKTLSQVLVELRADMVTTAEENVQAYAKKVEGEINVQQLIDKETTQLNSKIEDLQNKIKILKTELKQKKEEDALKICEVDLMKKDIQKKDNALKEMTNELKEKKKALEKYEKARLEKEKMKHVTNKPVLNELPTPKASQVSSQPVDMTDLDERPVKETKEQVIRWEESKKWQKKIEALNLKLKDRTEEASRSEKTINMLRDSVTRIEKEKSYLQSRLKSFSRNELQPIGVDLHHEHTIADLKTKIFQLENENNELYKKVNFDNQREVKELHLINNQLKKSLQDLEQRLDQSSSLIQRVEVFQKEIIEVRKENMELQFEIERAVNDAPRLKARIADLSEYNEILKTEIENLKGKHKKTVNEATSEHSVEEMQRVIAAMQRVVERLQTENDNFKKQIGKSKPHAELLKENRTLKQDIQRLKQLQATENKRPNSFSAASTVKMIQENEKHLKDLQKEREEIEKLRISNQSLMVLNKKLKDDIIEKDQALSEMEMKLESSSGAKSPVKGTITQRLYDGKIKSLENEIIKKNNILLEIKSHIKKSAERETELLHKIEELEEKISLLQDTSVDDPRRQLQQNRLVIDRLEKENKQLRLEVERLKELTNAGQNYVDVTQDEVLAKLQRYDRMMAIEVELRTKLKSVEIEKEKYKTENLKLKKELSAFDPAFFEELEDMKYNYKQALEQNILYEQQLRELSNAYVKY
ncbi:centrosomal protein of 290 kDa isoform X1 [Hydra vulgaris]|uniref:centrosomal protein of 290 kDa isoform X1 n=1 Tax=Hydra vulgaris TaxID=6087 RepID=UPI001F5FD9B7|nr:centrosomal protein of 290 kDa [Hydra vulgaris]